VSQDCLFCKFIRKEIPTRVAYEDDEVLAFHDIHPQAPVHVLLVPKRHLGTVTDVPPGDPIVSRLSEKAVQIAEQLGVSEGGFRLVLNCGKDGGQTIYHLHLHLLGGRFLTWPPG
jgi:histidine triad (HIT) family protein